MRQRLEPRDTPGRHAGLHRRFLQPERDVVRDQHSELHRWCGRGQHDIHGGPAIHACRKSVRWVDPQLVPRRNRRRQPRWVFEQCAVSVAEHSAAWPCTRTGPRPNRGPGRQQPSVFGVHQRHRGAIAAGTEFKTASASAISAIPGHYYAVSAYFAEINCFAGAHSERDVHPDYQWHPIRCSSTGWILAAKHPRRQLK